MNRHAEPRYTCGWPSRRMTAENDVAWAALVFGAIDAADLESADWYAEYLAENARRDADDRQGDFYDGDPDFD